MSLFVRLWIMGTVIALAAATLAIGAYVFVTDKQQLAQARHEAFNIGRLIAQAISVELFPAEEEGEDLVGLLEERALQFMAAGRLHSITVMDADLQPVVVQTLPGMDWEDARQEFQQEPLVRLFEQPRNVLHMANDTFYVFSPLVDHTGQTRFVLAIGLPIQLLEFPDRSRPLFISIAIGLSLVLGLIAAWVLTGQFAQPIRLLTTAAARLETGHFDTSALTPLIGRRDELGRLARTVLRLVQALDHLGTVMDASAGSEKKEPGAQRASADAENQPPRRNHLQD